MKLKIIIYFLFVFINLSLFSKENDHIIETWEHPEETFNNIFYSTVDSDKYIIASFYKTPVLSMTSKKIIKFAPYGQGPNDLTNVVGICFYKGDLAIAERFDKIKIYKKDKEKYKWKETKWLKSGKFALIAKNIMFCANKWFIAGSEQLEYKNGILYCSYLKVFDEKGNVLKQLIKKQYTEPNREYMMSYYIPAYKNKIFFLSENDLNITIISADKLEIIKKISLTKPSFYKKMPEHFYRWKKYMNMKDNLRNDLETWKMGYSRITNAIVIGGYLILQIRTCDENKKNFALLFYNPVNFKLVKTLFTDDFLMGGMDNKLYCYKNGNPGYDEDTDECRINIYGVDDK